MPTPQSAFGNSSFPLSKDGTNSVHFTIVIFTYWNKFLPKLLSLRRKEHFLTWGVGGVSQNSPRGAKEGGGQGRLGGAGWGVRRPHGGRDLLATGPCLSKRARAGEDQPCAKAPGLPSPQTAASLRELLSQRPGASEGAPALAQTRPVLLRGLR